MGVFFIKDRDSDMRTYSIYQQPCPSCGLLVSTESASCKCGYSFESAGMDGTYPEELTLQEEELFEAYLAARVDQTVAALEAARAEFNADKFNPRMADKLVSAVGEALALRDECDAQAAKIRQLRASLAPETETPSMSAQPTETFRAQQAAKAEKIMEGFTNTQTKTCPHCKTVLPDASALCLCGYNFARKDFMLPRAVDSSTRGEMYRPR